MGTLELESFRRGSDSRGHASSREDLTLHSRAALSCASLLTLWLNLSLFTYINKKIEQLVTLSFCILLFPLKGTPALLKKNAERVLETRG